MRTAALAHCSPGRACNAADGRFVVACAVRIKFEASLEKAKPFSLEGDAEIETNLVMSTAGKEERLAQQLQAMQKGA